MRKFALCTLVALVAIYGFVSCDDPTGGKRGNSDDFVTDIGADNPVISTLSGTITINLEAEISVGDEIIASYSGSEAVSFQWSKDGVAIAGATLATYTPLEPGVYTVTISVPGYESKTSAPVTVNPKNAVPGIVILGPDTNVVIGDPLTVIYIGDETVSFQWSKNGIVIAGATDTTYTPLEPGVYTVTVNAARYNGKLSNPVVVRAVPTPRATDFLVIDNEWTYNGSPQGVTVYYLGYGITADTAGTIVVYYSGKDGTDYAESTQAPTNAGSYDITILTTGGTAFGPMPKLAVGVLTIGKASGGAVSALEVESKTHNSITLNAVSAPSTGQAVKYAIT